MPIINLQRRQTEVGRIRIGESVDTGKTTKAGQPIRRPVKLEKFRFTSPSQALVDQVAALYGGTPAEWMPQGGGAKQWEVYTDTRAIPVVVPPNSVSQWYEAWNAGMCVRRCDGQRELLKDTPCVCPPDPADRDVRNDCKPTTRISLMLADVPGIGVWRLETHGFYAATELPAVAELLAASGGYIPARLEIEQRTAKRPKANGGGVETRHWMVPVLHVDAAPKALLSGDGVALNALPGKEERQAIEAAPADGLTPQKVVEQAALCRNVAQVQALWSDAGKAGALTDEVKEKLKARAAELGAQPKEKEQAPTVAPVSAPPAVEGEVEPNPDEVWAQIVSAAPADWTTSQLQDRVSMFLGKPCDDANGFDFARFLAALKNGEVAS